jgi:hypothetical protein
MPESLTPTFRSPNEPTQRSFPAAAVGIAGAVIAIVIAVMVVLSSRNHAVNPNQPQPLDRYAGSLALSQIAMSESTSLSGGKSTFLDGHVTNRGTQTVSAVTVQVFFKNDEGMPPHIETLPISLIRTRQPYVDTQPISADPLKPGDDREFRLIFESIPENWNTQFPEVHAIRVTTR